jgi:hypothetical protein
MTMIATPEHSMLTGCRERSNQQLFPKKLFPRKLNVRSRSVCNFCLDSNFFALIVTLRDGLPRRFAYDRQ